MICCKQLTHWKSLWCWEWLGAGEEGEDRGWDGWMASLTRWTWVWVNSGSCWWTGKPGVLQFMGCKESDTTEWLNRTEPNREGDHRGWDGWMESMNLWTWVWESSGSWWWTGKAGVLQFIGSQKVRHDWMTELYWTELIFKVFTECVFTVLFRLYAFTFLVLKHAGSKTKS